MKKTGLLISLICVFIFCLIGCANQNIPSISSVPDDEVTSQAESNHDIASSSASCEAESKTEIQSKQISSVPQSEVVDLYAQKKDSPKPQNTETRSWAQIKEDAVSNLAKWKEKNAETVGWLYIPHTTIDSPVLASKDNLYYLKHNENKIEDIYGALMSDCNNVYGGRTSQSPNLVVYGHSKDENPDGGVEPLREYEHFTELKRYQSIDFCRANPYIIYAVGDDAMVWEIFAVFHTKTDFVYNQTNPTKTELEKILNEARYKSLFKFDTAVTGDDKILTLSTCCRRIIKTYPNGYRFAIMARLVEKGKILNMTANVEQNPTGLSPQNIY